MSVNADDLMADAIRRDSGFVDRPADRGSRTNFDTTERTLPCELGRPATTHDIR